MRSGTIFAAIVGTQTVDTSEAGRPTVSVRGRAAAPVVPEPGSIVVARVRALQPSCVYVFAHTCVCKYPQICLHYTTACPFLVLPNALPLAGKQGHADCRQRAHRVLRYSAAGGRLYRSHSAAGCAYTRGGQGARCRMCVCAQEQQLRIADVYSLPARNISTED